VVRFEDVATSYGTGPDILHKVSFHLSPGSSHFVGGRMTLFGRDVESLTRDERAMLRRRIGVVFQDFRLLQHLSVAENVALPLRIAGRREDKIREHVTELLAWVGLADHSDNLPATLSGGQQQRVAIARAVIGQPSLLLADEPTGNVDDRIAVRLLYLFEELNKLGTTVVIATHNQALVSRFTHPVLKLEGGTVRVNPPTENRAQDAAEGSAA
jgi:cell division transport system ATP-binding protein